jgi:hypothetical protein
MTVIAASSGTLVKEIADFGTLVGLLLTLAALLTTNRAAALSALYRSSDVKKGQRRLELILDGLLAAFTFLVWLAGLTLAVRAVRGLHPLADGGPLRAVFAVAWILLLGLIGWQLGLLWRAWRLKATG